MSVRGLPVVCADIAHLVLGVCVLSGEFWAGLFGISVGSLVFFGRNITRLDLEAVVWFWKMEFDGYSRGSRSIDDIQEARQVSRGGRDHLHNVHHRGGDGGGGLHHWHRCHHHCHHWPRHHHYCHS